MASASGQTPDEEMRWRFKATGGRMKVILLFLDGVGIGKKDPRVNPFFCARLPVLAKLCNGELWHLRRKRISSASAEVVPVNATLGVSGLPQSGTGQATLFTGVNAARLVGKHLGPFPPARLRPVIEERNIFRQLKNLGKSVVFANAFPKRFFEFTHSATRRLSVTTLSCVTSGVPLLKVDALRRNEALSADFVRERWAELGHPEIAPITSRQAGNHLADIAERHDFTLFEYWLTDHAGHGQKMDKAIESLERFDEFLGGLLESLNRTGKIIILTSDHGNIEDLSIKSHTRNPVPCLVIGAMRTEVVVRIRNLTHIVPAIVDLLR